MSRRKVTTTAFAIKNEDRDQVLTGHETWPVMGPLLSKENCAKIMEKTKGLNRYWHCLEKTILTRKVMAEGVVTLGSMYIIGLDYKSSYGFQFNPPYEFHSWLVVKDGIIDIALAGAIEKGLLTRDHIGCVLEGREPIILAGEPLDYLMYKPYEEM